MQKIIPFFLSSFLLFSCVPATQTPSQTVTVYATSSTEPWLSELFTCANNLSILLNVNAESPEIYLRLGEPEMIVSPIYKIDEEEILVVNHRESVVRNLTLTQVQELFTQGDSSGSAQVWVYASDSDVQRVFDQLVMKGRSVSSFARVAVSPQNMFDVLNSESAAIGILPRHWVTGDLRRVALAGTVPVLAVTKSEPQGAVIELISCLQNN